MTERSVAIRFGDGRRAYEPGELLVADYELDSALGDEVQSVEWSVFWRTEGKGDEDSEHVHDTTFAASDADAVRSPADSGLKLRLPQTPLSYEGVIVKIRWWVSLRVRLASGEELSDEADFQLGHVPPAQVVTT